MIQDREIQTGRTGKVSGDCWSSLKVFTIARIALGRTGTSVPLKETLNFKLAHAYARDAVYSSIDIDRLSSDFRDLALEFSNVKSKAKDRKEYLQRPDLGRQLDEASVGQLKNFCSTGYDVSIIISDGLSATAISRHVTGLLQELLPQIQRANYTVSPVVVAENARVALADQIGELLKARMTIMLIGERPGLTSYDSLGAYITYSPKIGLTDEARNCVSNIRTAGLSYKAAGDKIFYLTQQVLSRKLSGVNLKDEMNLIDSCK